MSGRRAIGIVGGGRAGTALGLALARAGWPVGAIASRDPARRARLASSVPGAVALREPAEVAAVTDLVLLAVPDDAIPGVARALHARPGSVVAHLSGVHPAGVLREGLADEVAVGSFHPLVAFADVGRAADALRGGTIAIDGDPVATVVLREVAEALGARAVTLAGSGDPALVKAAYHAAAVLAAGGFVALLDAIAELGRAAGLDETTAVEVYGSLVRQGLANAGELGVGAALTGPVVRGDAGTLRAHLDAIERMAPATRELYLAAARRQLSIAHERGLLGDHQAAQLASLLQG